MRPFDDGQEAIVQQLLNEIYSKNSKVDANEDVMRDIVSEAIGVYDWKTKKNFTFWDFRSPDIGIEFKNHVTGKADPVSKCGTLVSLQMTRQIKDVPQTSVDEAIGYICNHYNRAVEEFAQDCEKTYVGVSLVGGENRVVYFHIDVPTLDQDDLVGEWRTNRSGTHNLYVHSKSTGDHVFTFWTNGNKLAIKIRVPSIENVHVFDVEQTSFYHRMNKTDNDFYLFYKNNTHMFKDMMTEWQRNER